MTTIKIEHLRPTGAELFQDSESYLSELTTEETRVIGGKAQLIFISALTRTVGVNSQASFSQGISLASFSNVSAFF